MTRLRTSLLLLFVFLCGSEAFAQTNEAPWRARGRKYLVKIDSSPQNATVYLNDKRYGPVGYTPFKGRITRGDFKLIVELPGYKTGERPIRIARATREFFVVLEKTEAVGTVDVQATADANVLGAAILVDNLQKGSAPLPVDIAAGRHLLEIKKEGFATFSQWLVVKEGERITMNPVLKAAVVEKAKGSILIDADVPDAEVYLDGQKQADLTPTLIDNVDEGAHVISVRKAPAVPWKQTVFVKSGERTKITAELAATLLASKGGNVRVLSNVEGARVFLDGEEKGKVPVDLEAIAPGVHLVQVSAEGYEPKEEEVTVKAGSSAILKITLGKKNSLAAIAKIKIVSPVPEAEVFIDGASVGKVPIEKELSPGAHFVTVQKHGFKTFEQKMALEAGQIMTVTAELRAVGTVRFLSNIVGAEVLVDGEPIGKTPLVRDDVDVGQHIVTIRAQGFYDFESEATVKGGETAIINSDLKRINTGPTPEEIARTIHGLTSFGARTMPPGRFTVDAAAGYPYWVEARANVGVSNTATLGWDVGVGFRSLLTTWEILGNVRVRFFERRPFAFAAFGAIGGGAGFDGRNMFTLQGGLLGSITFGDLVTVTGRT